jgi:predicted nucleotidyltransferase
MPHLGMLMPNMGIKGPVRSATRLRASRSATLADALFTGTQQRVLGLLFGQPARSFYATEVISLAGSGSGSVQHELARLARSGLVTVRPVGNQKHYQANPDSPLFAELCAILQKTVAVAEPLREALQPLAAQIRAAFVYGSVAKRQDAAASDIDLMLITDGLTYADVFATLEALGARLGRAVNPTILSGKDLAKRVKGDNAFVKRVLSQPKIWLIGGEDDLRV